MFRFLPPRYSAPLATPSQRQRWCAPLIRRACRQTDETARREFPTAEFERLFFVVSAKKPFTEARLPAMRRRPPALNVAITRDGCRSRPCQDRRDEDIVSAPLPADVAHL